MAQGSRSRKSPMRRPQRGGRGKGTQFFFAIILLGAIFAFFQIPPDPSVTGLWNSAVSRSETVEVWAKQAANDILGFEFKIPDSPAGGSTGPDTGFEPTPEITNESLEALTVAELQSIDYNRDEWKLWDNITSCWTVREQVLFDEAVAGSLALLDKNDNPTSDLASACDIKSGKWIGVYTGKEFTNPSDLDIDHLIPLKHAAQSGGQAWDENKKRAFANDLGYVNHLIAVDAGANRSKSDRGPADWKPDNEGYWCEYATSWITVSKNYQLTISPADKAGVVEMLGNC